MPSFTWEAPSGVEIALPSIQSLTAGMIRKHRNEAPLDFMFSILEALLDEDELAKVDDLTLPDTEALFTAWQASEGVSVPQS